MIPTQHPASTRSEGMSDEVRGDKDSVVSTLSPATTRSESTSSQARRDLSQETTETENTDKNEDTEPARGDLLSDLPECLQEFMENLVNESVQSRTREFFS